ncbi:unnamed protein product [Polarella glacialis]|uniref:Pentatricopeptide repeat-containing protein, chloroplastic n=1 Tax=Polarella glacialis TaxID=89957 RepID=A0A813M032_POLGL|nr:unnamed protein product [Polarella glacialis]
MPPWGTLAELSPPRPCRHSYASEILAAGRCSQWRQSLDMLGLCRVRGCEVCAGDAFALARCNAAITSCGRAGHWAGALGLLSTLRLANLRPDHVTWGALVGSAAEAGSEKIAGPGDSKWRLALGLVQHVRAMGQGPDSWAGSAGISACGRFSRWTAALGVLQTLVRTAGTELDIFAVCAASSACTQGRCWVQGLHVLAEARDAGVRLSTVAFNACASAYEAGHQWGQALDLLQEMDRSRIESNLITLSSCIAAMDGVDSHRWEWAIELLNGHLNRASEASARSAKLLIPLSAAISACVKGSQVDLALSLLRQCVGLRVRSDIVAFNTVLSGFERRRLWQQATLVIEEIAQRNLAADVFTFGAAVSAFATSSRWQEVLMLLKVMRLARVESNAVIRNAALTAFAGPSCRGPDDSSHLATHGRGLWAQTLSLLSDARAEGLVPDGTARNAAAEAAAAAQAWQAALGLVCSGGKGGGPWAPFSGGPDALTFAAAIAACTAAAFPPELWPEMKPTAEEMFLPSRLRPLPELLVLLQGAGLDMANQLASDI